MLKNLTKIAFRNLLKRKFYSFINILGLGLSICFSLLLWIYVQHQSSYDQHFESGENIYRVNAQYNINGKQDIYSNAARPVGPTLKNDIPEIEEATRIRGFGGLSVHAGVFEINQRKIKSNQIFIADSTFFNVFKHEFISGNPEQALNEPNSLVITEGLANRIFGKTDVLNETITLKSSEKYQLKITGVIKDNDYNTHLPVEAITYWNHQAWEMERWYGGHVYTYVKLGDNQSISTVEKKIPAFIDAHMKKPFEELEGTANLIFQPLTDIYLDQEYVWEPYPHGSRRNLSALRFIILFLLVFACINYVNLATARSTERSKEVGMRKVLGSSKNQLLAQFLTESVLLSLISGILALLLSGALLSFFNDLSGIQLSFFEIIHPLNLGLVFLISVFIGIIAGLYPALYLASLESIKTLKGKFIATPKGELLRNILVTAQYIIAAILISSIIIVYQQTQYVINKEIGFDKENILLVQAMTDSVSTRKLGLFAEELKRDSRIVNTTKSRYSVVEEANHFAPTLINPDGTLFQQGSDLIVVDHDFVETIGLQILQGRNFRKDLKTDEFGFLINETAAKQFGWESNPLEGKMEGFDEDENGNVINYKVLGVVKDFNLGVSYEAIKPLIIFLSDSGRGQNLFIRMKNTDLASAIPFVEGLWQNYFPSDPFEYTFLDQSLAALYEKESKFLKLLSAFSVIIVFIASLGIIGLISYTTELKRKEIAIRKVHGSPLKSIAVLLTKKFVYLLGLANIVAFPVGFYFITQWLDNFTFRIDISIWPYLISFFVCALFTMLALTYHTLHAASVNPSKSLRME